MSRLDSFFTIEYGDHTINAKEDLDRGSTIVISSQGVDNGCYGFYDVEAKYQPPVISVPRTGSIAEAFVQLHPCDIDDNCLVLKPKEHLPLEYLFYIAAAIRREKWRYLYGRQVTPYRLGKLEVAPKEYFTPFLSYSKLAQDKTPIKNNVEELPKKNIQLRNFNITVISFRERSLSCD